MRLVIIAALFLGTTLGSIAQTLTSSNLPIVVITTNGNAIEDDPKVMVDFGIIDNGVGMTNNITDQFNDYDGNAGIEFRGNSTQGFDKKNYSVELWSPQGTDTSAALLGLPKEEDWILHAMMIDKSLLRIPMSFYLAQRMGHYASRWKYCELVIDGDYQGVYALVEKLKRDKDRVDIARLDADDLAGDSVTGGYILRLDWLDGGGGFESNYNALGGDPMFFQWYYPKEGNILPAQAAYIESWMAEFESALYDPTYTNSQGNRYNHYLDETSFADFLISNEVSKNSDGYKLSSYVHKDKESKGGRLNAGPIWDFDQTYGVSNVCSCNDYTGWTYTQSQPDCEDHESMPMWWETLMGDPVFTNHLACRWNTLRQGPLHIDTMYAWIDDNRAYIQTAADRNFVRWPVLGVSIWAEPQPMPQDYQEEIDQLKDWITSRMAWLDTNMPGDCAQDEVGIDGDITSMEFSLFPNPSTGQVHVQLSGNDFGKVTAIEVFNMQGAQVKKIATSGRHEMQINLSSLNAGMYMVRTVGSGTPVVQRLIIQ
jgi:hypothetical protein